MWLFTIFCLFSGIVYLNARDTSVHNSNIRLAERDYWSVDPDLRCDTSCENEQKLILWNKSILHAADNQSLSELRLAKVEPLYDLLNEKIQQFGIPHEDLMSRCNLPTSVIHVNNSYVQSQFVSDISYGY